MRIGLVGLVSLVSLVGLVGDYADVDLLEPDPTDPPHQTNVNFELEN